MPPKPASIRIIGGESGGRKIPVPQHRQLRPSGERVRESLFNRLGQRLDGLVCLDLFAGSGVLGLEAASRGAAHVVLVERQRKTAMSIRAAAAALNAGTAAEIVVLSMSAEKFLAESRLAERRRAFDLIFLEPAVCGLSFRRCLAVSVGGGCAASRRRAAKFTAKATRRWSRRRRGRRRRTSAPGGCFGKFCKERQ